MRKTAAAATALGVVLATTGCVSAGGGPSADSGAAVPTPTVAAECDLFSAAQLQRQLGVSFVAPRAVDPSSTATTTVCQWTATDQTALVITKVLTEDARLVFEAALDQSKRTLGPTASVDVPGAKAAFSIPSLGRTGMLVGDTFVEVSVLVPSATPEQVAGLAASAARSAARL